MFLCGCSDHQDQLFLLFESIEASLALRVSVGKEFFDFLINYMSW